MAEAPDLLRLWLGEVVSQLGDSVFQIALLWLMLELTGSKSATGLVAMSIYLPTLLFGLFAGALADRLDRRRMMLGADLARALLVLLVPALYYAGGLNGLLLGCITFAMAMFNAAFNPARDAIIPQLVPRQDLLKANSMIQSGWQFALLLGPALAGLLIPLVGEVHLFTVDALTFMVSFVLIMGIHRTTGSPGAVQGQGKTRDTTAIRDVREGLSYARGNRCLWALLMITAVDNLFIMGPAIVGTPIFVREILHGGAAEYAFLLSAYAVGTLTGTVLLNIFGRGARNSHLLLWGILLDGLTFLPLMWVKSFAGAYLTLVIHSLVIPMIIVPRPTLVQKIVPAEFQGRIFSMISVAVVGLSAVSAALTGLVSEWLPINEVYGLIALLAAGCGVAGWAIREFREAP